MVFSSSTFLFVFLPIVLLLYFNPLIKTRRFKNVILLFGSIIFYFWGEPVFIFIVLIVIGINWKIGLCIAQRPDKKREYVLISVFLDIGILVIFKYLNFITENIAFISGKNAIITNVALPIGISFFTFQMMSYIFDIANGKTKPQKSLSDVMLYVLMFPQLIAGPIVRYETVVEEIHDRNENIDEFSNGICRFIIGLSKKVLIANQIAILADTIFSYDIANMSVLLSWLGAIAYTIQIYFDFSGYSDMAIGLGQMFGFHFLENFNYPYKATSISDFWRRWHISMGTWFKDYVYIPMGGSHVKSKTQYLRNLFTVWLLTGIWHGANWTFILWGLMFFVLIAIEKQFHLDKNNKWYGHVYTMLFVIFGWVLFRSDTLGNAIWYIKNMLGLSGNQIICSSFVSLILQFWKILFIGIVLCILKIPDRKYNKIFDGCFIIGMIALFAIVLTYVVKGGYNPFIYFNF